MKAFSLIYACYERSKFISSNRLQVWLIPHHLLSTTHLITASSGGRLLGTLTLVEDDRWGLPLASLFPSLVCSYRKPANRLVESTCLAIDPQLTPTQGARVLEQLLACAGQVLRERSITHMLTTVHPRHAKFYEKITGFRIMGSPRPHSGVSGKLAVPLCLELATLGAICPRAKRRYLQAQIPEENTLKTPMPVESQRELEALWNRLALVAKLRTPGLDAQRPGIRIAA